MANHNQSQLSDLQRGSLDDEPRFLVIGVIRKPHGVRGEVRVTPLTDEPDRFTWLKKAYLGHQQDAQPIEIEKARLHKDMVLVKIVGYDDRTAVDDLRGQYILIDESDAIPLEEGEYYLHDLLGLVVSTNDGETLGELTDVIETLANNVFQVTGEKGEVLLPDIPDVILDIDFDAGTMTVALLPGLLND